MNAREHRRPIDPDATLKRQRELARAILDAFEGNGRFSPSHAHELAELALTLDKHIQTKKTLPEDWK